jgi:hypothetical protein
MATTSNKAAATHMMVWTGIDNKGSIGWARSPPAQLPKISIVAVASISAPDDLINQCAVFMEIMSL